MQRLAKIVTILISRSQDEFIAWWRAHFLQNPGIKPCVAAAGYVDESWLDYADIGKWCNGLTSEMIQIVDQYLKDNAW